MKFLHVDECEEYPMVFKMSDLNPGDLVGILVTPNKVAEDEYWVGSLEGTPWILPSIFISMDETSHGWETGIFMIGRDRVIVDIRNIGCLISKNQQEA